MPTPYQTSLALVSVNLPRGVALVLPTRAQWLRDALAKLKPLRPWKLTSVRAGLIRHFPQFTLGMLTGDYVRQYVNANHKLHLHALDHVCERFDEPAPMLDPALPEVEQMADSDDTTDAQGVTW